MGDGRCAEDGCFAPTENRWALRCCAHQRALSMMAAEKSRQKRQQWQANLRIAMKAAWARRRAKGEIFRTPGEIGLVAAASSFVHRAIRYGFLAPIVQGTKCVDCGGQASLYEHRDYARPLDVEPVCVRCNAKRGKGRIPPLAAPVIP